jgi:hypothetical protein
LRSPPNLATKWWRVRLLRPRQLAAAQISPTTRTRSRCGMCVGRILVFDGCLTGGLERGYAWVLGSPRFQVGKRNQSIGNSKRVDISSYNLFSSFSLIFSSAFSLSRVRSLYGRASCMAWDALNQGMRQIDSNFAPASCSCLGAFGHVSRCHACVCAESTHYLLAISLTPYLIHTRIRTPTLTHTRARAHTQTTR